TCRELGIGLVAYSPLGRGFLTGKYQNETAFEEGDFRASLPRFHPENIATNRSLMNVVVELASRKDCTPAQIALAWLMAQGEDIVPIPGTRRINHLQDNVAALSIQMTPDELEELQLALNTLPVAGERYTAEGMKGINA